MNTPKTTPELYRTIGQLAMLAKPLDPADPEEMNALGEQVQVKYDILLVCTKIRWEMSNRYVDGIECRERALVDLYNMGFIPEPSETALLKAAIIHADESRDGKNFMLLQKRFTPPERPEVYFTLDDLRRGESRN